MIVKFLRFQIDEGVVRGVSIGEDPTHDGLRESVEIMSSIADMSPKVIIQYFMWFADLLFNSTIHNNRLERS